MKILFLLNSHYKHNQGGAEFQAWNILELIKAKGHEVCYVYLSENDNEETHLNTKLYRIKKRKFTERLFGKIVYYFQLKKILEDIKPNIIYHRNISSLSLAAISYCSLQKCKFFLHLAHIRDVENELYFGGNILKRFFDFLIKRKIIFNADKIVAQAQYQTDLLEKNFNRSSDLIMPNIHPITDNKIVKQDKLSVLWVANLKSWKQPQVFINLAEACQDLDAGFVMIGRNNLGEEFKVVMERIHKLENLSYLGELPLFEVNKFLSKSHVFVNTSLQEGFPNTFIEVSVVSLHVDPDNVLVENKIGFHSRTFDQLVKDINLLAKDSRLRKKMGERSRQYAEKNHSIEKINELIKLMESCK